jgi:hypothetical protein
VTRALIGQGLCALLMLILGALGLLRAPFVLGILLLGLVLLRREVLVLASVLRRAVLPEGMLPRAAVASWAVLAIAMVVLALAPPWDWDTLMYHQTVPMEFLRSGTVHVPLDNLHVALIGVAQLASLPLLSAGLAAGPAMTSVASYLLLAGAMVGAARVVADEDDAWWSVLLMLGVPGFVLVATTARIDATVAGALMVAHALTVLAVKHRTPATLMVAAVCFGVAGGMKLHGLAYAAACAPLALYWWKDRRTLALSLGAFMLALAPWLLKNAVLFGAPFFPLGAPPRFEPWLAAIAGNDAIPAGLDTRAFAQLGESRMAFNIWDGIFAPERLTIELDGRYYGLPLVLLLLPLALYALRRRPYVLALALPPLLYLLVILIPFPRTNLRYLFPAIPPLLIATVIGVRGIFPRPVPAAGRRFLVAAVLAASVFTLLPAVRERVGPGALLLRWAVGAASEEEVRTRLPDLAALERAVAGLGPDSRVLMLWEARSVALEAHTLADVRLSNWPLLSQTGAPDTCLAGTGISHVVLNLGTLRYYIARGASAEVFRLDQLRDFVQRCLIQQSEIPPYLVFRVRDADQATPP